MTESLLDHVSKLRSKSANGEFQEQRDPVAEMSDRMLAGLVRPILWRARREQALEVECRPGSANPTEEDPCSHLRIIGDWVTTRRIAELICLHPDTVRGLIGKEGLPARKLGGRWKYYPPAVARWLEKKLVTVAIVPPDEHVLLSEGKRGPSDKASEPGT